jgi:pyruvate kinase
MENTIIFNKTKIIATVGPASNSKEKLTELIKAGVDVFRLNFSHGSYEAHQEVIDRVREINKELGTHICLLQDLQGPKIRTRDVENGQVDIVEGQDLIITTEKIVGTSSKISTTYESLPNDVSIGDMILIDDGKLELKVTGVDGNEVKTKVIYGGPLKSKKGINLPDTNVSAPCLTDKDEEDLQFGLKNDCEWIALSFVRTADDIRYMRSIIEKSGKKSKIVAKVERPEALKNIDEIIEATDAVMVARGDLGVEIVMEDVPMAQKMIVQKCNEASKPVIIATQMMESMIENPRPTRAETNDIANAVMDGADALMLSAETATGKYPIQTIKSMARTISSVETQADHIYDKYWDIDLKSSLFINDSLVASACRLSKYTGAKAIIGMTKSGYTAFRISSHRPKALIFVFTDNEPLLNTLSLLWGVRGFYYDKMGTTDETFTDIENLLKEKGHLTKGDIFVNMASMPLHWTNRTNMAKISVVE